MFLVPCYVDSFKLECIFLFKVVSLNGIISSFQPINFLLFDSLINGDYFTEIEARTAKDEVGLLSIVHLTRVYVYLHLTTWFSLFQNFRIESKSSFFFYEQGPIWASNFLQSCTGVRLFLDHVQLSMFDTIFLLWKNKGDLKYRTNYSR